uniref:Cystatin domain-containing protein n=1 Tax=Angiostrongylus costaricensis TaxID=334426 RepID=A0A0R3PFB8_ANGCS
LLTHVKELVDKLTFPLFLFLAISVRIYLKTKEFFLVPRGIFHYSNTDNTFDSNFKIPNFEALDPMKVASELMSAAAKAENRRKAMIGIFLPLPFAGKPLNFEVNFSYIDVSIVQDHLHEKSGADLTPEAKETFMKAKYICLHSSTASCDEVIMPAGTFPKIEIRVIRCPSDPLPREVMDCSVSQTEEEFEIFFRKQTSVNGIDLGSPNRH